MTDPAQDILVIRHGETASNAARIVQTPEVPLSPRGIAQADLLARRLARGGIGLVLASDLPRAAMTAERLARATGAPLRLEPLLQERNFGDLRGTPYAELAVDLFAPDLVPPAGESWADFHERVRAAWDAVRAAAAQTRGHLAVVTHGLVCFALVTDHFRLEGPATVPMRFANTSVTVVTGAPPWTVRRLDCTAHLAGVGGDDPLSAVL